MTLKLSYHWLLGTISFFSLLLIMNCHFCYINPVCVTLENTKLTTKDKFFFFLILKEGKVKPETGNLCSITGFFLSGFDSEKSPFDTIPANLNGFHLQKFSLLHKSCIGVYNKQKLSRNKH